MTLQKHGKPLLELGNQLVCGLLNQKCHHSVFSVSQDLKNAAELPTWGNGSCMYVAPNEALQGALM